MQIQKINGQNYSANKQQLRAKENPSFGWVLLPTAEFRKFSTDFGIADKSMKVITKVFNQNKDLSVVSIIDKGMIKTDYGDVFGSSMDVFASRRVDDLQDTLNLTKTKAKKLTSLEKYVENLCKSKKISMEFEKNTIESPDHVFFNDLLDGGESYKNIKSSIKDAAAAFSKHPEKDNFILRLGFDEKTPGVVKAHLIDKTFNQFAKPIYLKPKNNSSAISNAVILIDNTMRELFGLKLAT